MKTSKEHGIVRAAIDKISGYDIEDSEWNKDFYDIGLDALDVVELVMQIEADLQISINDNDVEAFECPEDIVVYLRSVLVP